VEAEVEALQRCRAMEAFCRQHARMEAESERFWLAEAADWAKRLSDARLALPDAEDGADGTEAANPFAPNRSPARLRRGPVCWGLFPPIGGIS
jgi:hypothetical protein